MIWQATRRTGETQELSGLFSSVVDLSNFSFLLCKADFARLTNAFMEWADRPNVAMLGDTEEL